MTGILQSLSSGFLRSAARFSDREALNVAGRGVTYQELAKRAKRLAATLQARAAAGEVPLTAGFASRSVTAYAAVLGALMAGWGGVSLKPNLPRKRAKVKVGKAPSPFR